MVRRSPRDGTNGVNKRSGGHPRRRVDRTRGPRWDDLGQDTRGDLVIAVVPKTTDTKEMDRLGVKKVHTLRLFVSRDRRLHNSRVQEYHESLAPRGVSMWKWSSGRRGS